MKTYYTTSQKRRYDRTKRAWDVIRTLAGVRQGSTDVYEADRLLDAIERGTAIVTVEWEKGD